MVDPAPPDSPPPSSVARDAALYARECRLILSRSWPVSITYLAGYLSNVISASIVGHLGADALASAALATVYGNATGYAVLYGVSWALDTLSAQAVGAGNFERVGAILNRAVLVLLALSVPVCLVWLSCGRLLLAAGQDPALVANASIYLRVLMAGMPALMVYEAHKKTLQAIGDMTPPLIIAGISAAVNALLGSYLVHGTPMGLQGGALANVASQWIMLCCMLVYFKRHRELRRGAAAVRALCCGRQGRAAAPAPATAPIEEEAGDGEDERLALKRVSEGGPAAGDFDAMIDAMGSKWDWASALSGWGEFIALGIPSAAMLMAEVSGECAEEGGRRPRCDGTQSAS